MSNTVKQLGFIPTNRGEFDTTGQTRYYKDNVVQYRNGSYICSPVGYSSSNPTAYTTDAPYQDGDTQLNPNWKLMASVGLVDSEPTAGSENLVKSGGVYEKISQLGQEVYRWNGLVEYSGSIESTTIVTYQQTKYKVIEVKDGGTLVAQKGTDASVVKLALLSSFTYNPSLPYTLIYASGESRIIKTNSDIITHTIGSDVRYILVQSKASNGSDLTPNILTINGVDYLQSVNDGIGDLNKVAVKTIAQSLTSQQQQQARVNISAGPEYVGITQQPMTTPTAYYRPATGGGWYLANTSDFRVSDLIKLCVGDIIEVVGGYDNNSVVKNLFFNANANSYTDVSNAVANAVLSEGKLTVTQAMLDAGYVYFAASFKVSGDGGTPNARLIVHKKIENLIEELTDEMYLLHSSIKELTDKQKNFIEIKKIFPSVAQPNSHQFRVYIPCSNGHRVCYVFDKYYKKWDAGEYTNITYPNDVVATDFWNNTFIGIDDILNQSSTGYIIQGNTNYIYKLYDTAQDAPHPTHVGDGHGCEVSLYRKFFADGTEVDIESMDAGESVFCRTFRYIAKTKCFNSINVTGNNTNSYLGTGPVLDESNNPIIDCYHFMDAKFELGNKVTVDNRMYINQNGLQFYALFDAMLECDSGKYSHVYVNADNGILNEVVSYDDVIPIGNSINIKQHPNNFANIVEMYGVNHYVKHTVIQNDPARARKQIIHSAFYSNTDRLKHYFSSIGQYETQDTGVDVETFNKGDVISVTHIREIELKDNIILNS